MKTKEELLKVYEPIKSGTFLVGVEENRAVLRPIAELLCDIRDLLIEANRERRLK